MDEQTKLGFRILGGSSSYRFVSIESERFNAYARWTERGIRTTVREKKSSPRSETHERFLPEILRLGIPLYKASSTEMRLLVFLGISASLFSELSGTWVLPSVEHPSPKLASFWITSLGIMAVTLAFVSLVLATWHGAEHKAISAYETSGCTDLRSIRSAERIDPSCGTRFYAPLVLIVLLAKTLEIVLGTNLLLIQLLLVEALLQLDARIGLQRIFLTREISIFLQRYVVTREPDAPALLTAQAAMQALLNAHANTPPRS